MSAHPNRASLDEALQEVQRLRRKLTALETASTRNPAPAEPIAIVGMGCRFPGGVNTPDEFWTLLSTGRDGLGDIPPSRWQVDAYYDPEISVPGKMYVRQGHYLDGVDQFDPQFFGLSPREAASLDPQQRLLLEVSWEALEHAGIAASDLKGGQTGVFVGQYWDDYSMQRIYATDQREIDRYAQLSGLRGLAAGRIAHILDAHGPAMQVDTACSSSSLAVHLACRSLACRESDLALAGGVSLILAPQHLIGICQMKALSADGRCKTFDAKADGFGQGEGCGMVALKRLADAQADGDRILAVIHGSAANHDGHARTVTTPSGPAQRAMLQSALANAGLHPHQLDYIETHGTGTPLGDPIEVMAIARVLCQARQHPLYLGSVKTNVGHLDAAAGIAGLMKVVLSLQHQVIPAHLNFSEPNPRIPWSEWPLRVPTASIPWDSNERYAGISAFGMSGTNVHLIVGQAPPAAVAAGSTCRPVVHPQPLVSQHLLTLSAHNQSTLPALARRYAALLQTLPGVEAGGELADVCYTAAVGRSHFAHRIAIIGESSTAMQKDLLAFAGGSAPRSLSAGVTGRRPPKVAFLFTGQGAQYVGMGRQLYDIAPTFRFWLDQCAYLLREHLDKPLLEVMWSGEALHQTAYTQPALFALEYALAKLWQEWGIEPELLLGHSIGEYAAACMADVFSLEDGLTLVAARGRLMQSLPCGGEMVSVAADEATVSEQLAGVASEVSIAAVNGPRSIVISGRGETVQEVVRGLHERNIKTTQLKVSHAFHSPLMEPILADFHAIASQISYRSPAKTVISNVTGQALSGELLSAEHWPQYWVEHLRGAVRFADGIAAAHKKKIETFVEVGPRPTLLGLGRGCVPAQDSTWLPSLRPEAQWTTLLYSLAQLHLRGANINWLRFHGARRQKVTLPNYPWRRQRYWTDIQSTAPAGPVLHPLVHRRFATASSSAIFESNLSASDPAYLADHRVFDSAVFPASAYFEMALAAGRIALGHVELQICNVSIQQAMLLTDAPLTVQIIIDEDGRAHRFGIFSKPASGNKWTNHAAGTIKRRETGAAPGIDAAQLQIHGSQRIDLQALSQRFNSKGVKYGPSFMAIAELGFLTPEPAAVLARIELPKEAPSTGANAYQLHPVLLDASLRIGEALFPESDKDEIYLPFAAGSIQWSKVPQGALWVKATGTQSERIRSVNLRLFDQQGEPVAAIDDFTLRPVSVFGLRRALAPGQPSAYRVAQWLYQLHWERKPYNDEQRNLAQAGSWLILADANGCGTRLAAQLEQQGQSCCIVAAGPDHQQVASNHYTVNAKVGAQIDRLVAEHLPQPLAGVVHLWSLDAQEHNYGESVAAALHLVQSLKRAGKIAPVWLVTRGAQAISADEIGADAISANAISANEKSAHVSIWQAPLWGFGRTLQIEHPEFSCTCVDLEAGADDGELLLRELGRNDGETQIAYRCGERYVARVRRAQSAGNAACGFRLQADASYLVTGGLGALGLQVAQFLVASGARHLFLIGRKGTTTAAQQTAVEQLQERGVRVQVVAADMSSPRDVNKVLQLAKPTLRGIIHAAGVLDDGMLTAQTAERFQAVAAPKVGGAWQLHVQTLDHQLDFFVMFSSVASLLGSAGQANYCAANALMDALAHFRNRSGLPALAINWGPWADVGMATSETVMRRLMNDGWQPMTAQQGCEIMAHLVSDGGMTQAGVIPLDWPTFVRRVPGASQWPVLSELVTSTDASKEDATSKAQALARQVKASSPNERHSLLTAYLLERIAQTLRVPASDLNGREALSNLGIDSLTAVELITWIRVDLAVEVAVEQMFSTPDIGELASVISKALAGGSPDIGPSDIGPLPPSTTSWITQPHPRPQARMRLFCFPYAGGGASAFRDWPQRLPEDIEVCVMQLPGREERLQESPVTQMSVLVDALTQALLAYVDKPFAFLGHSMGAIVSYEVARQLRTLEQAQPVHLFLSSRAAPQLAKGDQPLRFLPDQAFIEQLHHLYGAVPESIRRNADLQNVFLPILRADVTLLETHSFVPGDPLDCPITVFGGEQDRSISPTMLAAWREQTCASFTQQLFPGDHFYIVDAKDAVASAVAGQLAVIREDR
ncbi:MAG: SDR family NAD(P)-dependent oxidoreductase [Gammaproteobacteria bacterium]|nr:SDR family NAD(P)-dependent oxidoreductase [Gammaproteobacteria bacterium]